MLLRIFLAIPAILAIVLLFHPNEARLRQDKFDPPALVPSQDSARKPRQLSVLAGDLPVTQSSALDALPSALREWAGAFPGDSSAFDVRVQASSARFSNPAQVRVSLGFYPGRVEARDGVFVPAGGVATVSLPAATPGVFSVGIAAITGDESFDASLDGTSVLSWKEDHGIAQGMARLAGGLAPDLTRRLLRLHVQFIRPQAAAGFLTGRKWHDFTIRVPADATRPRELRLSCGGESPCVFSRLALAPDPSGQSSHDSFARENFVIVLVDTLRADAVLSSGAPGTFKKFNDSAAVFTSAMAPGNMTSPSTNALLSCHTPTEIRDIAFAYAISADSRESWYRGNVTSFPRQFSRRGYRTAMIGNISVVSEVIGAGVHHGFDQNVSIETEGYETPLASMEASRWIAENRDAPFFLYVHLNAPHGPYKAPLADVIETWPGWSSVSSMAGFLRWFYRAEVNQAARAFQRILDAIDAQGLAATTNVILLADHGDQHVSRLFHGNEAGPVYQGAFFDHGATLITDEVGVPFSWRGPGVVAGVHKAPMSTLATGPAMLMKAGISPSICGDSSRETGGAVLARLGGKGHAWNPAFGIEGYHQRAVVYDGRWKYVRAHEPTVKKMVPDSGWRMFPSEVFVREELYDLESDPAETRNLVLEKNAVASLVRARREYDAFYRVTTGFELVVETPLGEAVHVPALNHRSSGVQRVIIPVPADFREDDLELMRVTVGGKTVPVASMTWRLPLDPVHWKGLPREVRGEGSLLPPSGEVNAYLRRVPSNDAEVRRIVTGNPMFDQILREWGYLHDD